MLACDKPMNRVARAEYYERRYRPYQGRKREYEYDQNAADELRAETGRSWRRVTI